VVLCSVYTYLALIGRDARYFYLVEREELIKSQLRDNATLIGSIRNLTRHPVYGLQTQLHNAR